VKIYGRNGSATAYAIRDSLCREPDIFQRH